LPGIISDVTEILLDAGFYAQRLFGDEIKQIREADATLTPSDAFVAAMAVSIQHKINASGSLLFPPAIDLNIVDPPDEEPQISFALLFLPGIILMAVMFASNGLAADYWVEREQGTLRRLVYAPSQLIGFLAGKAVAAGVLIALIGGTTMVLGFIYHGITWSKLPLALVWMSVSGVALFAWFSFLQMLAPNRRAANIITSMLLFPLLMAGGSFFPFAALPDWIATFGRRTPNGFIADRLTQEITTSGPWAIDPQSWMIVIAMTISGLLLCGWRLQTGFARN
jgi:ABC-type multidrug transport system permease subunit